MLVRIVQGCHHRVGLRLGVSLLSASAVLVQAVAPPALARQMSKAEYEACQARDEAGFRSAIDGMTHRALQEGIAKVNYPTLVADDWRKAGFDESLDKEVDLAVGKVGDSTSLLERGRSLFDKEKAQQLAQQVAESVYGSAAVKAGLEGMTVGVLRRVGDTIAQSASDATEPALECLKAFLGPLYGATIAKVATDDAQPRLDRNASTPQITAGTVLSESKGGVAGAVILVVRRQLANIATRVSQRVVGSVLGRLVGAIAGPIGLVLIAKDIWELRNGVLPIVATEMKSKATKDLVRAELAKAISEQINEHTREIASATADRVIEIWREFRRGHAKVVELAERNDAFRGFVDTLKPADLARLDEVVALLLSTEGEDGVLRRLRDGTLAQAVTKLPAAGMDIAREQKSLDQGLQWSALAGNVLPQVMELGLYKRLPAGDITAAQLRRILALDDRSATTRLAAIPRAARDTLLELQDRELKSLAKALGEADLQTLASYLTGLEPQARERVMKTVAATPARMQALAPSRVRDGILASKDQLAAVNMMLRADAGFDLGAIKDDVTLVYGGRISPVLMIDKHPAALAGIAVGLLLLLLVFQRLLFGRRGRAISRASSA